jgi:hypothetical protein
MDNARCRLCPEDVAEIRQLAVEGCTHKAIAGKFAISESYVSKLIHGVKWAHTMQPKLVLAA